MIEPPVLCSFLQASFYLVFSCHFSWEEKDATFHVYLGEDFHSLPAVTELSDQGCTLIFTKQELRVYWVELFNANTLMSTCIEPLMGPDKF